MNNKKYFYLSLILSFAFFLMIGQVVQAVSGTTNEELESNNDAIAVRILPNPNHYSIARWYQNQGFSGSPQALLVDGYEAVRDGRTVYVNAANVDDDKEIYTNIYLISYNQTSEVKTVDALGQIIDHWQFNSNLADASMCQSEDDCPTGTCNISTLICQAEADCPIDYTCEASNNMSGRCLPVDNQVCYVDADCDQGLYCDSLRAKVARDVNRLVTLVSLKESIEIFKQTNGKYPVLGAGTYVPLTSISTWPSWQSLLLPQIGVSQPAIDPINSLGSCTNTFDPYTCWDQNLNTFADTTPSNGVFNTPNNSYVFIYSSNSIGSVYKLCMVKETGDAYDTVNNEMANNSCGSGLNSSTNNLPPILISTNLVGEQGQEFNGFIKVIDPNGDPLQWSLLDLPSSSNWNSWTPQSLPSLLNTSNPNQKKVYAEKAGDVGDYDVFLTVSDGHTNGTTTTTTKITIINKDPLIQADDIFYSPSTSTPLTIKFSVTDKNRPIIFNYLTDLTKISGPYNLLDTTHAIYSSEIPYTIGDTTYYTLKYNLIPAQNQFATSTNFVYKITAKDSYQNTSTRQININIKPEPPILDFNCPTSWRVGDYYSCRLGWKNQGNHIITYATSTGNVLPAGLKIEQETDCTGVTCPVTRLDDSKNIFNKTMKPWSHLLSWLESKLSFPAKASESSGGAVSEAFPYYLQGTSTVVSTSTIKIKATNEYGAVSEREFNLSINDYCGDGVIQLPNLEGRGGFYNDGYEDCDRKAGVTNIASTSSSTMQYKCSTGANYGSIPYPIPNSPAFCTYLSPAEGGGYCGDAYCNVPIEKPEGFPVACPIDCGCSLNETLNMTSAQPSCACNPGWNDCDATTPGCETNGPCLTTTVSCNALTEYECNSGCYLRVYDVQCTPDGNHLTATKCKGLLGGNMKCINCGQGYYNCDGLNECDDTYCDCPTGQVWQANSWPNGGCVPIVTGCNAGETLCQTDCCTAAEQCCPADIPVCQPAGSQCM